MPDWKDTLNLPRTDFPMKANLQVAEPETIAWWDQIGLYPQLRAQRAGRPRYVLHDGPPYANGQIHLGTALNKILKDLVVKSKSMAGFDAPYVPGYDCHGLPIELKVDRELGPKKRKMSTADFRRACRAYAERFIGVMTEEFQRVGVFGDWEHPYLTMNFRYQAAIARALGRIVERGLVYKGKKPVHWCIHCRTALAEAEVEYESHTSPSIYVEFPLRSVEHGRPRLARTRELAGRDVSVLIWTTTPWTIPSNLAIAFHPDFVYGAYPHDGRVVLMAEALMPQVAAAAKRPLGDPIARVAGKTLEGLKFTHPLYEPRIARRARRLRDARAGHRRSAYGARSRRRRLPDWAQVRARHLRAGRTGRPVHGRCRAVCRRAGIRSESRDRGSADGARPALALRAVRAHLPALLALPQPGDLPRHVAVVRADGRRASGHARWHGAPRTLRDAALRAIDEQVEWIPPWGRDRIYNMVANRPDWCISRQRAWGVPIPALDCAGCGEAILTPEIVERAASVFDEYGADAWYERPLSEFVPDGLTCGKCGGTAFERETNILDVWFDSGSSHEAVLPFRPELTWPADLYLEGSDQHRGWFQSSLLIGLGTRGAPPFRAVLTHGFFVDEEGRKMSKSLGNTIEPQEIIAKSGAEIIRLWSRWWTTARRSASVPRFWRASSRPTASCATPAASWPPTCSTSIRRKIRSARRLWSRSIATSCRATPS